MSHHTDGNVTGKEHVYFTLIHAPMILLCFRSEWYISQHTIFTSTTALLDYALHCSTTKHRSSATGRASRGRAASYSHSVVHFEVHSVHTAPNMYGKTHQLL